jgi:integrase
MMQRYDVADALAGVRPAGCVQPHIRHFVEHLRGAGYALLSTRQYIQGAAHLGRWMQVRGMALHDLTDSVVSAFARHRCTCREADGRGHRLSRTYVARVQRFVEHLRAQGLVAVSRPLTQPTPAPLNGFREWLRRHRGLAPCTINRYELLVAKMLPGLGEDPTHYDAAGVRRVVLAQIRSLSRGYAKCFVAALRAFLRFLAVEGRCRPYLDQAVPILPEWRLSALPRYLESADVERVIAACDLRKPSGIRDRAVLLLLARLGLRAGDIVGMNLDDLDWQSATVRVRAKSRTDVRLPLPQDAGDAILAYLMRARPITPITRVFLCTNAPIRPLPTTASVSDIVRLALRRAGIRNPPSKGAHLLRHSAATAMLRAGASLDTIATVLRHASPDMTAHYAKVDLELLKMVAQPWPEVSHVDR